MTNAFCSQSNQERRAKLFLGSKKIKIKAAHEVPQFEHFSKFHLNKNIGRITNNIAHSVPFSKRSEKNPNRKNENKIRLNLRLIEFVLNLSEYEIRFWDIPPDRKTYTGVRIGVRVKPKSIHQIIAQLTSNLELKHFMNWIIQELQKKVELWLFKMLLKSSFWSWLSATE